MFLVENILETDTFYFHKNLIIQINNSVGLCKHQNCWDHDVPFIPNSFKLTTLISQRTIITYTSYYCLPSDGLRGEREVKTLFWCSRQPVLPAVGSQNTRFYIEKMKDLESPIRFLINGKEHTGQFSKHLHSVTRMSVKVNYVMNCRNISCSKGVKMTTSSWSVRLKSATSFPICWSIKRQKSAY